MTTETLESITTYSKNGGGHPLAPPRSAPDSGHTSPGKDVMGIIGGELGVWLLRCLTREPQAGDGASTPSTSAGAPKVRTFFGERIWDDIVGKTVLDFGCGLGREAIAFAKAGAKHVIGLDIRDNALQAARRAALEAGVSDVCTFTGTTDTPADTITSFDAFEHFGDPSGILTEMARLLRPDGAVWITFGPPWYHPYGGHFFSIFPWSHLIFTERALIRWRAHFKNDGATRFGEVEGGLNQMSIGRFRRLVTQHGHFRVDWLHEAPIRKARYLCNAWTKEFLTATVQCRLVLARK